MSVRDPFTPDVCRVIDIFYAAVDNGDEPDWEAIRTAVFSLGAGTGMYSFPVDLLRAIHAIYEDEAWGLTRLFREKHNL